MLKTGIISTKLATGAYGKVFNLIFRDRIYALKSIKEPDYIISQETYHDCYLLYHLCSFYSNYFVHVYELEYQNDQVHIVMEKALYDLHSFIHYYPWDTEFAYLNNLDSDLSQSQKIKKCKIDLDDISLTSSSPSILQSHTELTRHSLLSIFISQITTAIQLLHKNSIVHYDIKPLNILVFNSSNNWTFKLTDFGMSTLYSPLITGRFINTKYRTTERYQCPENIQTNFLPRFNSPYKADLWSFGITILEYINGLFTHKNIEILFWIYNNSYFSSPISFDSFKTKVKDGSITGLLNTYNFKNTKYVNINTIEQLQYLLDLNPKSRNFLNTKLPIPSKFALEIDYQRHNFTKEQYEFIVNINELCCLGISVMLHTLHLFGLCHEIATDNNWKTIVFVCYRMSHIFIIDDIQYEDFVPYNSNTLNYEWIVLKHLDCQIFTTEIYNVYNKWKNNNNNQSFLQMNHTSFFEPFVKWFNF